MAAGGSGRSRWPAYSGRNRLPPLARGPRDGHHATRKRRDCRGALCLFYGWRPRGDVEESVHSPGQRQGQPLLVLESMKMETTLPSPRAGVVVGATGLHVGAQIEEGQVLLRVVEAGEGGETGGVAAAASA